MPGRSGVVPVPFLALHSHVEGNAFKGGGGKEEKARFSGPSTSLQRPKKAGERTDGEAPPTFILFGRTFAFRWSKGGGVESYRAKGGLGLKKEKPFQKNAQQQFFF